MVPGPSRATALLIVVTLAGCGPGDAPPSDVGETDTATDLAIALPAGELVDLTHPFNDEAVYWPTADGFQRTVTADGITEGGYHYAAGAFSSAEHGGTHLDAPIHFAADAQTADQIPLDRLMGPAVVVDVTDASAADADYRFTVADLERWEARHGAIPDGAILLFRTGFSAFWPDRERYMGTAARGQDAVADLHFPGLHPDAASWLVQNRSIAAVGLDTPSIDYGQSTLFEAHRVLAAEDIPIFENVAHLDRVPPVGALVIALPMKIEGGTGGPLRIVALVN